MRAKPMILILIALGCGLVASIGISQVMDRSGNAPAPETVKVFVAMKEVDIGEKLDAKNIKLEEWPKDRVPDGAITKLEDAQGQYPSQRLYAGEPILKFKISDGQSGAIKHIPDGFTVVSVKVTMDSAVSGLLKPGDHVDVMVYLKKNQEIAQTTTRTILRQVRVFAVNENMTRENEKDDNGQVAKTVSLLVEPKQAERITLAAELGKIRLSLRRPDDHSEPKDQSEGASVEELLGGTTGDKKHLLASAANALSSAGKSTSDFMSFLNKAAATPAVVHEKAQDPWVMHVYTPEGPTAFQWTDEKSLPQLLKPEPADGSNPADIASPMPQPEPTPPTPPTPAQPAPDEGADPADGL